MHIFSLNHLLCVSADDIIWRKKLNSLLCSPSFPHLRFSGFKGHPHCPE